jgi:nanoRNase/pAp phosphatase (c-di-AMP/oligoRNAs hydrolase)
LIRGFKDTVVVNIDNKPENQGYGDIVMVSNKFSSISEAVANLILTIGGKMDLDIAENLMLGLLLQLIIFRIQTPVL